MNEGKEFFVEGCAATITSRLFLRWTKDKPTVPGYYFMRSGPDLRMVKVYNDGTGLRVLYHGSSWEDDINGIGRPLWCGPVAPPAQKD